MKVDEQAVQEARATIADPVIKLVQELAASRAAAEGRPVNAGDYLSLVAGLFIASLDLTKLAYPGDEKQALYCYRQMLLRQGVSIDRARGFHRRKR